MSLSSEYVWFEFILVAQLYIKTSGYTVLSAWTDFVVRVDSLSDFNLIN